VQVDELVQKAMAKWPHVPICFGSLGLDSRGYWYLRDDASQATGAFRSGTPGSKGSRLVHEKLIEFIQRNYACDEAGRWYFQNGPQRVYVELQTCPWIWRLDDSGAIQSHTGLSAQYLASLVDEKGWLYLHTPLGLGLLHTADMARAADLVQAGVWAPEVVRSTDLPLRFAYVCSPQSNQTLC
jgi:hypothetical protein